jgi:hypothetical protein
MKEEKAKKLYNEILSGMSYKELKYAIEDIEQDAWEKGYDDCTRDYEENL